MTRELSTDDIATLAKAAGLRVRAEDLEAIARALNAHLAFVEPLLDSDPSSVDAAMTLDTRWRD